MLCAIRGDAPARMTSAAPGLSWMSLPTSAHAPPPADIDRRPGRAGDLDVDERHARLPLTSTPVPSGVAASPTIRNPTSSALGHVRRRSRPRRSRTPSPGSRMIAPRGTRLTSRTSLFKRSVSRYSPGSTTTSVPGLRASMRRRDRLARPDDDRARVGAGAIPTPLRHWVERRRPCERERASTTAASDRRARAARARCSASGRWRRSSASDARPGGCRLLAAPRPRSMRGQRPAGVNRSPSTYTTVTLSLPPASLAASISARTTSCGRPAESRDDRADRRPSRPDRSGRRCRAAAPRPVRTGSRGCR